MVSRRRSTSLNLSAAIVASLALAGCGGGQSSHQALDSALKTAGMERGQVYPLEGTVTVDGQPPELAKASDQLVVVLHEPAKLDKPALQKLHVSTKDGHFSFTTYDKDDGVKPGKYIITFSILERHGKRGLLGPDKLKNLYNDPEKNQQVGPPFVIDVQAAGKRDYSFNLEIAGKDAASPGPHAVTDVTDKDMKN